MLKKTIPFWDKVQKQLHTPAFRKKATLVLACAGLAVGSSLISKATAMAVPETSSTKAAIEEVMPNDPFGIFLYAMKKGGPVMWPLLVGLIVGTGIVLERLKKTGRLIETNPEDLLNKIINHVTKEDINKAIRDCLESKSALAAIFKEGLKLHGLPIQEIKNTVLEIYDKKTRRVLEQHLNNLDYISEGAPIAGAIGTLLGLVEIFGAMRLNGAGAGYLYNGMMQAVFTSIFGYGIHLALRAGTTKIINNIENIDAQVDLAVMEYFNHFRLQELKEKASQ